MKIDKRILYQTTYIEGKYHAEIRHERFKNGRPDELHVYVSPFNERGAWFSDPEEVDKIIKMLQAANETFKERYNENQR